MSINDFIEKFAEQFDDTAEELFTADLIFKELDEWDSLSSLSIIAMIDEEYEIQLSGEDLRSASSLSELFDIVKSKM